MVFLLIYLVFSSHRELEDIGQRVNHRDAYTMQTTRDLIGVVVEFTPSMKRGHDHFCSTDVFFRVYVDWNSTTVVSHGNCFFWVHCYVNGVAMPSKRLVYGVIN